MTNAHRTADFHYAAFLKTAGVLLVGTERKGKRVTFLFENTPNIQELKMAYFNRTAKVPALTYVDELKAMKSLTYSD